MIVHKKDQTIHIPLTINNCHTFLQRLKGLMFRRRPITHEGLLLTPCNSIHMFFMFFPIDVVFLSKDKRVVYIKENVKPWTVIPPINQAASALELPVHTISTYTIEIGDTVTFN